VEGNLASMSWILLRLSCSISLLGLNGEASAGCLRYHSDCSGSMMLTERTTTGGGGGGEDWRLVANTQSHPVRMYLCK